MIRDDERPTRFTRARTHETTGAWDVMIGRRRVGTVTPQRSGIWWAHHANGIYLGETLSRREAARRILMADVTFI